MEIPKVFEETLNNFTTFYHEKHTGRTLTWLYSQSKVCLGISNRTNKYKNIGDE